MVSAATTVSTVQAREAKAGALRLEAMRQVVPKSGIEIQEHRSASLTGKRQDRAFHEYAFVEAGAGGQRQFLIHKGMNLKCPRLAVHYQKLPDAGLRIEWDFVDSLVAGNV